jgi:phage terminase large subunit-like protein
VVAAQRPLDFFRLLRHSKGKWADQPFVLEPWQQFIVWSLFGWKLADGTRRFRVAYIELPKKNGKSTLLAGIGLYLLSADGEAGAEVYCAAAKKVQARIIFDEAVAMRDRSPALCRRIQKLANNLCIPATRSKMEPICSRPKGTSGPSVSGAMADELHEHDSPAIWELLNAGTTARRQPLCLAITNSGFDRETVCWKEHEYSTKLLEQIIEDDSYFAFIAGIDEGDDWQEEAVWEKAKGPPRCRAALRPQYISPASSLRLDPAGNPHHPHGQVGPVRRLPGLPRG